MKEIFIFTRKKIFLHENNLEKGSALMNKGS